MSGVAKIDDGGPAFPGNPMHRDGMSLRDYLAAAAMQGWLASYGDDSPHPAKMESCAKEIAIRSYAMADAMLAARK